MPDAGATRSQDRPPRNDIEHITAQQPSGPDPGGELGRLDPLQGLARGAFGSESRQLGHPLRLYCAAKAAHSISPPLPPAGGHVRPDHELVVDPELQTVMQPLLADTQARLRRFRRGAPAGRSGKGFDSSLCGSFQSLTGKHLPLHCRAGQQPSPRAVASAAVAAAEASGALPPLAGPQRAALEGWFSDMAEALDVCGGQAGFPFYGKSSRAAPCSER